MRHHQINQGDHYAVSENSQGAGVLVQIQEAGEQARVTLSPAQARHMGAMLIASADKVLALEGAAEHILPQAIQGAMPTEREDIREKFDRLAGVMTDLRYCNQGGGIKKRSL